MPVVRLPPLLLALSCLVLAPPSLAEPPPPLPSVEARPDRPARAPMVTPGLARAAIGAALRASGFLVDRRALESMASRARTSGLLPELWLRASRSTDQSLRLSPTLEDPAHYSVLGGAGIVLEARLMWHLDRLVFDREELSVERLKNDRAAAAAKLCQRVLETLFVWQKASFQAEDPDLPPDEREAAWLARIQAEVTLGVLTAGWFEARTVAR